MIAIIPISGFTEKNRCRIGMRTLWKEDLRPLSSPEVFVHPPVEWSRNPKDLLGTVSEVGASDLIIIGYSWGLGFGARKLVKEALKRGFKVRLVASCDGVWKSIWPRWAGWLLAPVSLTKIPVIKFPAEVSKVMGVRQWNNLPSGHDIWHGGEPLYLDPIDAEHGTIDEHPEWRCRVMDAIEKTITRYQK